MPELYLFRYKNLSFNCWSKERKWCSQREKRIPGRAWRPTEGTTSFLL